MSHSAIKEYFLAAFDSVWTVFRGMQISGKYMNIFREKPITLCYPDVLPDIQPGFRGRHVYVRERCIACRMCEKACPVDCIAMDIEGKGKAAVVHSYKVDYTKCLLCNLCAEACPVDCLWLGTQHDLTTYTRAACVMEMIDSANADLKMPERARAAQPEKKPKPAPAEKPAAPTAPAAGKAEGGAND